MAARLLVAVDEGELETILAASDGADAAAARDASLAAQERLTTLALERARGELTDAEWRVMRPNCWSVSRMHNVATTLPVARAHWRRYPTPWATRGPGSHNSNVAPPSLTWSPRCGSTPRSGA